MSDPMSFAELETQHVELLPARTVLSTFITQGDSSTKADTNPGQVLFNTAKGVLGMHSGSDGAAGTNTDGNTGTSG